MSESKIEELEVKVAFLEEALNKLSDEHYAQQKELEKLKLSHAQVLETVRNNATQAGEQPSAADEVPPHY